MKFLAKMAVIFLGLFSVVHVSYAADVMTAVQQLNQDWNNTTRQGCKLGDPDFACSGVTIHVFDMLSFLSLQHSSSTPADGHKPWMPSQEGIKKGSVSFSYLRRDIAVDQPLYQGDVPAGYIFTPTSRLEQNNAAKLYDTYCEYPINAATNNRDDKGCGGWGQSSQAVTQNQRSQIDLGTCRGLGIDTPEKYMNQSVPYCSLSPDQAGFTLMINIIKYLNQNKIALPNDEVVIAEWSTYPDNAVPIEAFFYTTQDPDHKGEMAAYNAALAYAVATGIHVPVVEVDVQKLMQGAADPFFAGLPGQ